MSSGSMRKIWIYDSANDRWVRACADSNGYLKIVDAGDILKSSDLNIDASKDLQVDVKSQAEKDRRCLGYDYANGVWRAISVNANGEIIIDPITEDKIADDAVTSRKLRLGIAQVKPANTSRVQQVSEADISGFSVSVYLPEATYDVFIVFCFITYSTHSTYGFHLVLRRDGTHLRSWADVQVYGGAHRCMVSGQYVDKNVSAGSYTYKLRWAAAAGTGHRTYANNGVMAAIVF